MNGTPISARRWLLVAGGGIFGLASALELRRRGHRVTLFDRGSLPRPEASTTDVSKIVRMDYGSDELYSDLAAEARVGWHAWNLWWERPLYHEDGFLVLAGRSMDEGGFEAESWRTLKKRGYPLLRLGEDLPPSEFPSWSPERYPDGYFNPRAGWAESGAVAARLVGRAREVGVEVREGTGMARLLEEGSRVTGIVTGDGEEHRGDGVVVAAGAWTPTLLPWMDEVMWATGQPVLHFRVEDPGAWQPPRFVPWAADVARTGWYGFPALDDGRVKIGHHGKGRRVDPDGPLEVDPAHEERCREFLRRSLPDLADAPLASSRLCLYADTFDSDFWIDRDPDRDGLVVAAGGSGHGFKFAPVLGGIVADVVEGRRNRWARRFAWRPPGEEKVEPARTPDR